MNENNNNLPEFGEGQFQCPYCGVLAQQHWSNTDSFTKNITDALLHIFMEYRIGVSDYKQETIESYNDYARQKVPDYLKGIFLSKRFDFSKCESCRDTTVWLDEKMIYPTVSPISEPNEDLDEKIKELYREARSVYPFSARAAAALLRLCVEKLCAQLGEKGTLNEQIKSLVAKGVSEQIQQALDYCRVIGNSAVHPGTIDIEKDPKSVLMLFSLVNDIAQEVITKPKEMQEKYASLPPEQINQIRTRDKDQ